MRMRSSSGPASSRLTLPTCSRRSRSLSRKSGQSPSSCSACTLLGLHLHQHVRAAAQVEPEIDQPVRQAGRPSAASACISGVSVCALLDRARASFARSTRA